MTAKRRLDVVVQREGRWWVFTIPALDTGGQAKSLAEVPFEAQDVAAMWLDVEFDSIEVRVTVAGLEDERGAWAAAELAEAEARKAQARAAQQKRAVVAALTSARGLSAADAGRTLGISTQRVYQLLTRKTTTKRTR
ncbi:antitoxin HicB [Agrococcus sp. KRD186]|uniref:antitoxin HicB n=1 Tax=Agrococcus sp. KRD186 TaxID=2729730 RepID=UPI0019CF559D|nr:antitoxin HicB [Agrococcus sp. KRD186]